MPQSLALASPVSVMPWAAATSFQQARNLTIDRNTYPDGSIASLLLGSTPTSRKYWTCSSSLTAAQLTSLRTFYGSHLGPTVPFYFYDVYETSPIFTYDITGSAITGRYVVRFKGNFVQALSLGRHSVSGLQLIEVT